MYSEVEVAKGNLLQVRTYDVLISYDKYYQTPRLWLIGYDEVFIRLYLLQHTLIICTTRTALRLHRLKYSKTSQWSTLRRP